MLLPFTQIIRRSASDEPTRQTIGIDTEAIARVEPTEADGESLLYCDGTDRPYRVEATVEEIIGAVHCVYQQEEEPCEPVACDTE